MSNQPVKIMQRLTDFMAAKYPGNNERKIFRDEIGSICRQFVDSGKADVKFENEITSGEEGKFWSCLSEALIFDKIKEKIFLDRPHGVGPDFLITDGKKRIWIEVICPEPVGIPQEWKEIDFLSCLQTPHNEILLRWTSAFREKSQKLLRGADCKSPGYLAKGLVSDNDSYVIAINGCRMRHGPFSAFRGISQLPYAVEAVFPVGPYQVVFDIRTRAPISDGYQERFFILNGNESKVPLHSFLDTSHEMISAIWAVDFNGCGAIGNPQQSAVIHNPFALNPIQTGFLPSDEEFRAVEFDENTWKISIV